MGDRQRTGNAINRSLARVARTVQRVGRRIAPPLAHVADRAMELGGGLVSGSRRRWQAREARRHAQLRRRSRTPLPNLYDLHPGGRNLSRRELGLRSIPVDEIAGTAVAGITQRGSDFLPLPAFRSNNWQYRFQAIQRAMARLTILPPIDVLRYDGKYWVEDGHNRVAAALYAGQVEIDATVTELRAAGAHATEHAESLAAVLESGRDLRAAAAGRFTPTAPESVTSETVEEASEERERLRIGESGARSAPDVHGA